MNESKYMECKAFLSHRYRSPQVNLYFHDLFVEFTQIQFEVDIGPSPTSVTRLERMIRDSDAFIGIFPFGGDPREPATRKELLSSSKYFRLECELAIRSSKPSLVFIDKRYVPYFQLPSSIRVKSFDIQEITGKGGSPSRIGFQRLLRDFCDEVSGSMVAKAAQHYSLLEKHAGIVVPTDGATSIAYSAQDIAGIKEVLTNSGFRSVTVFPWPPNIHQEYLSQADNLDLLAIDIGRSSMASGIVGYLHGRFIPTLRLLKSTNLKKKISTYKSYQSLFGGIEAGYEKDIVVWDSTETLKDEIKRRMLAFNAPVERINTPSEAESYFRRAARRKETIFLSYSGLDRELALKISRELKNRFQIVFDYKDGESITPGEPWLQEIFDKLSVASLGIPLVSSNYFASGNCEHEALEMVAKRDANKMSMIPLKLYSDDECMRPSWMSHRQYMHYYDYPEVEIVVDKLIQFFDRSLQNRASLQTE